MGNSSGSETTYPIGASEFIPSFSGVSLAQSFVFYVMFCISLSFCLFVVVLSCLSDYPFDIFKLFLCTNI
jgi:hypothetical protein